MPSLDGIRAISVMLVLLGHFVDRRYFPAGLGVLVFFVISGFLISRLLLAEFKAHGRIDLKNFYIRRFLRLYPVVVVLTLFVVAYNLYINHPFRVLEPISTLFYFANYYFSWLFATGQTQGTMLSIFWSLSVEEHFYFLFPALLLLLHVNAQRLAIAMLSVMVFCLALRLIVAQIYPELVNTYYFYYRTEFRLDSLAVGVLIAALCELPAGRRFLKALSHPGVVFCCFALLAFCLAFRDPWFRETIRYSLLGLAVAGLISAVLFSPRYWPAIALLNTSAAQ